MTNKLKKHKHKIKLALFIISSLLLFSILNILFLPEYISKYLILLLNLAFFFIISFKEGKKRQNKGYIGGLKISLIGICIYFLINLIILHNIIGFKTIIYYLIIILISIYASVLGINKKAS